MATEQQFNELMGRMITDEEFRKRLMADPKGTAEKAGYDLTSEELDQFDRPEMAELVGAVDERVSKMALPIGAKDLLRRR